MSSLPDYFAQSGQDANDVYRAGMVATVRANAEATEAQRLLAAAVSWHQRNEDEPLPEALLAILVAARKCC